jgi:adenine specific DNA methylase Mod
LFWLADNLDVLRAQIVPGSVDLIYIDPPFNSKRNYNIIFKADSNATEQAFTDIWSNVGYLEELDEINSINPELYSFLKLLETTGLPSS